MERFSSRKPWTGLISSSLVLIRKAKSLPDLESYEICMKELKGKYKPMATLIENLADLSSGITRLILAFLLFVGVSISMICFCSIKLCRAICVPKQKNKIQNDHFKNKKDK